MNASPPRGYLEFIAHGMGLISHEAPRLATNRAYSGYDADRALQSGMVVSIETTMKHPRRGFIKLEDTLAVTENGFLAFCGNCPPLERGRLLPRSPDPVQRWSSPSPAEAPHVLRL